MTNNNNLRVPATPMWSDKSSHGTNVRPYCNAQNESISASASHFLRYDCKAILGQYLNKIKYSHNFTTLSYHDNI